MSTKEQIEREADAAADKLRGAADEVKRQARDGVADAQRAATGYAEEGKNVAAGHLTDFAKAVRSASDELSTRDQGVAARFVTEAADGLERVASSISGTSVDEMAGTVQDFARKNPGAFLIGSVLAGVALGRFAKASSERNHAYTSGGHEPAPVGPASLPNPGASAGPASAPRPATSPTNAGVSTPS